MLCRAFGPIVQFVQLFNKNNNFVQYLQNVHLFLLDALTFTSNNFIYQNYMHVPK